MPRIALNIVLASRGRRSALGRPPFTTATYAARAPLHWRRRPSRLRRRSHAGGVVGRPEARREALLELRPRGIGLLAPVGLAPHQERHEEGAGVDDRSEEHTSELQSRENLVCRL